MSEYKPITVEIREQMEQAGRIYYPTVDGMQNTQVRINLAWLTERLDAIDAIHAALEVECERYRDGWIELPKDADGEYIHIGDVLTDDAEFKSEGVVERLMLDKGGWFVGFGVGWTDATLHEWHHYHASTVEDVLEELLREYDRDDSELTNGEIVEMFAKRLTLAGDAE